MMDKVIPHEYHDIIFVYYYDLLIVSAEFTSHVELLKLTAKWVQDDNLTINLKKKQILYA